MMKINLRLLGLLQAHKSGWCHPEKMLAELRISRKRLLADIELIREYGFTVRENPHLGYQLDEEHVPLVLDIIEEGLKTEVVGRKIKVFGSVTSTMDIAHKVAEAGRKENGCAVFAEEQTEGRGRFDRSWVSKRGRDILLSVVLFPGKDVLPSLLTVSASLAVCRCLREEVSLEAKIRFPNDVVVKEKKIAGILVEKAHGGAYVLGAGVNVNEAKLPLSNATSLRVEKGEVFDRNLLSRHILTYLDDWYRKALEGRIDEVDTVLRQYNSLLGKSVTVIQKGKRFTGTVAGLGAVDGLTLAASDGDSHTFKGEHITLIEHERNCGD
jgi:BirA family biotin operon repressor/biotin-[acetyl-CoA-carboxylase] ligase